MSKTYCHLSSPRPALPVALAAFGVIALAFSGTTHAATYTNAAVTATTLNTAGTVGDPTLNILDNYASALTSFNVGSAGSAVATPYIELRLLNGATISSIANPTIIGGGLGSDNNKILVNGAGSTLTTGGLRFDRGLYGDLTVSSGGSALINGTLDVGYRSIADQGNYNSVVVDGGTLTLGDNTAYRLIMGYNANNHHNSLTITNGGVFTATGHLSVGRAGTDNSATVSGRDSKIIALGTGTAGGYVRIGELAASGATANTLTVEDEALVRIDNSLAAGLTITKDAANNRYNYLQLNGGFVAWAGDHTAFNAFDNNVKVWDGSAYQVLTAINAAALNWSITYFDTSAAALAATGYEGLGGYTILTGGVIPEPATLGLIGIGGLTMSRRRRA